MLARFRRQPCATVGSAWSCLAVILFNAACVALLFTAWRGTAFCLRITIDIIGTVVLLAHDDIKRRGL
jgi:hypothetical protein